MKTLKNLLLSILILCLIFSENAYAISIELTGGYYSDRQLGELAIEKGIIPEEIDGGYLKKATEEKNSVILWIIMNRESKIRFVDRFKKDFQEAGTIIKNPSGYYVDEMTRILYRTISNTNEYFWAKDYVWVTLKAIALMEGDFDNGKSKVEALKDFVGEDTFERYKREYPEKYEYLLSLDK